MDRPTKVGDGLETLAEVAERTGINLWWLRRMCQQRKIAYTKNGRWYCLTSEQVEAARRLRLVTVDTAVDDDVARENERRALRPRRRRISKAA
ncbi:hypothetical protein GCM10010399_43810 [Dactylosporangium fulvum]|uniref:Helix-turn-helix domain-containing protein n=1 Tax=Dactylosporangium fulvum TaxID=53359 RepID=A0ABY5W7V2_9ACTN|nr:hypothetical protein [Dactylosporangium fulvum]UWP85952.1 hypothetical protein Dfulv_17535 [Dactylosporangium fulvum]